MTNKHKKVIINADDLGLLPGVTYGILYAHQFGLVSSTTAMVNTSFAKSSLEEAKKYPELGVGLHWVLDAGQPVFTKKSSLTDHKGFFKKGKELKQSAHKQDLKNELEAQLELIDTWYGSITHIDSHHHMHLHIPSALEAISEVAEENGLAIRTFSESDRKKQIRTTDFLNYTFYGEENVTVENLTQILSTIKPGTTEVMCHPAFMDPWLSEISSYNSTRMKELAVLTSCEIKRLMEEQSISFIHYGGLADGY